MSEKANRFLIELSQDPVKMEDYWKDPDSLLAAADLTAEEKEILRSGNPARLEALFGPLRCNTEVERPNPKPKPRPKPRPKPKPKTEAA